METNNLLHKDLSNFLDYIRVRQGHKVGIFGKSIEHYHHCGLVS
jgi:hypothetical protein